MKGALVSFVGLPLVLIALTTSRFGFRTPYTLAASVLGEVLGLLLYATYKTLKWPMTRSPREQIVYVFSSLFAAAAFALGLIRLVNTGSDLRMLWMTLASSLGAFAVRSVGVGRLPRRSRRPVAEARTPRGVGSDAMARRDEG
jgi:hypothetical protein